MKKERELDLRQNFLSMDKKIAMDSFGVFYRIGDVVKHEGSKNPKETAVIEKFSIDKKSEEIKVNTNKGHCHLDFIYHT